MCKLLILLFIIGHVLGDYYLQSNELAVEKNNNLGKLNVHCIIYFISMLVVSIPVFSLEVLISATVISLIHWLIDFIKFNLKKNRSITDKKEVIIYLIDQFLHVLTIIFVVLFLEINNIGVYYINFFRFVLQNSNINLVLISSWILISLIIVTPCKITIKKIMLGFRDSLEVEKEGSPNAGALIGILERAIVVLLLSVNQYSAIGFVLTAKSIARYKKITDSAVFAEYYLIGTLLSNFLVIVFYLLIF